MNEKKINYVWLLVIVVAIFFGAMMLKPGMNQSKNVNKGEPTSQEAQKEMPQDTAATMETSQTNNLEQTVESSPTESTDKTFKVEASNFKYNINQIKVKKGEKVTIEFKNVEGFHDWRVDEFNVKTNILKAGESENISFVADKAGTFEFYCSVGQHRAMGMKGMLTVEE